jgi:hypothetical protein
MKTGSYKKYIYSSDNLRTEIRMYCSQMYWYNQIHIALCTSPS